MTKEEYDDFKAAAAAFFNREGINGLMPSSDNDEFSVRRCDCCGSALGGRRHVALGFHPKTHEVYEYRVCDNCMYYAEYGQLDDETMLSIDDSE